MEIQRSADGLQVRVSYAELVGLANCLNEVSGLIEGDEDFEKWIGTKRDKVESFHSLLPEGWRPKGIWGDSDAGLAVKAEVYGQFRIEFSDTVFRVVRNCLYETCNWIRLYEFQTRIGIELEDALVMLRLMTNAIKTAN